MKCCLGIVAAALLAQGCATNIYLRAEAPPRVKSSSLTVRVTNPQLEAEYVALRTSGIFTLTTDATCDNLLTLHEMRYVTRCGTPFLVTLLTLGLVPVRVPVCSAFFYDLKTSSGETTRIRRVPLDKRVSLWERPMRLFHSNASVLAEALRRSEEEVQSAGPSCPPAGVAQDPPTARRAGVSIVKSKDLTLSGP